MCLLRRDKEHMPVSMDTPNEVCMVPGYRLQGDAKVYRGPSNEAIKSENNTVC